MSEQFLLQRFLGMEQVGERGASEEEWHHRVPEWSVDEVVEWVRRIGFAEYVSVFEECGVDGDILLLLKDKDIKEDLGMTNGILRKRFLRDLRNLRKISDYSCCNGAEVADFLSSIGADFREYTYNLVNKDMSVDYMKKLEMEDLQDMMIQIGIENKVHQRKIIEAVYTEEQYQNTNSSDSTDSSETSYDVYLTYPRPNGAELASLIKMQLEMRGISVFSDSQHSRHLNKHNLRIIQETKHFALILPPGGLDTCLVRNMGNKKLQEEIVAALAADANIVPVTDNFQWPDQEELHEDVRAISYFNSVRWVHDYQDACIGKLERFIRGENMLKVDSPFSMMGRISLARSRKTSGVSTPGISTPNSKSRKSSSPLNPNLLTNLLMVPRSVRKSNLSLVSNDSGLEQNS